GRTWSTRARNWRRACSSVPMISLAEAAGGASVSAVEETIGPDLVQIAPDRRGGAAVLHAGGKRLERRQRRQRIGAVSLLVGDDVDETDAVAEPESGIA